MTMDVCGTPDFVIYLDLGGTGGSYQNFYQFGIPESSKMPISDMTFNIPGHGTAAAEAEILSSGTLSSLSLNIGIGACIGGSQCDSKMPVIGQNLPLRIIDIYDMDFSGVASTVCKPP